MKRPEGVEPSGRFIARVINRLRSTPWLSPHTPGFDAGNTYCTAWRNARLAQQAVVIALLDDASFFHHNDPICGLHGGQTVRDQDAGEFCRIRFNACWICHSVNGSMLAVASSRMKMAGCCIRTRISATSWRCPIESRSPRLARPRSAGRPEGSPAIRRRRSRAPSPASRRPSLPARRSGYCPPRCRRTGTGPARQCPAVGDTAADQRCGCRARRSVRRPCWILVEARDQFRNGRLACAGVSHQGKGSPGLMQQVEVRRIGSLSV